MFGRCHVEDPRDQKFKLRRISTDRLTRYWSSRYFGNQGQEPSCVGFAWMHWLEASPISQYVLGGGIYKLAQYLDEWQGQNYEGTSVRAGAKALSHLGFIKEYRWATKIAPVISAVLETGPVVIGIDWREGMLETNKNGFIKPTGKIVGGHAILIDGVNKEKGFVRLKNSWGKDWGQKGRAKLKFDDLQTLLSHQGEACLGIERKPPKN